MATEGKRKRIGFQKGTSGNPETVFAVDKQPTPEQKKAGWARKLKGQELVKAILEMKFKGRNDGALRKYAAAYYECSEDEITVEMMMHFRQAEKAIQKNDTAAYQAVMNRAMGMPKQITEEVGEKKIRVTITKPQNG